jgi:DNA-directed RNA polymerase subunit RPC12/RpoP
MAMMFVGAVCMSFIPVKMLLLFKETLGFWSYPLTLTLFVIVVGLPLRLRVLIYLINNSSIQRQLDREKSSDSKVEPVAAKLVVDVHKNQDQIHEMKMRCSDCSGTGRFFNHHDDDGEASCPYCGGRGFFEKAV